MPGTSREQRPDPPSVMPSGHAAFIDLVRELKIDVQLVKFLASAPILAPKISIEAYFDLEKALRGARCCACGGAESAAAHCSIDRLLQRAITSQQPELAVPMIKAGLIPALSQCGATLVRTMPIATAG